MDPRPDTATVAYHYWLEEGRPEGRSSQHWARAELAGEIAADIVLSEDDIELDFGGAAAVEMPHRHKRLPAHHSDHSLKW